VKENSSLHYTNGIIAQCVRGTEWQVVANLCGRSDLVVVGGGRLKTGKHDRMDGTLELMGQDSAGPNQHTKAVRLPDV
jgi:hypothetical protein